MPELPRSESPRLRNLLKLSNCCSTNRDLDVTEEETSPKSRHSLSNSFGYAFDGLRILCREERNFRLHLVVAGLVCGLAFALQFTLLKWSVLLLTIGLVVTTEALNSAIETLVDLVQPEQHPLAKRCKDVAAGAVLIAALISVIIGLLLFVPPLWNLVSPYLE